MKRAYAKRGAGHKSKPSERRGKSHDTSRLVQRPRYRDELLALMQDSLESLAVERGLLVAADILEDEVARLSGPRYRRQTEREHTPYGRQRGVMTLAGQKLPIAGRQKGAFDLIHVLSGTYPLSVPGSTAFGAPDRRALPHGVQTGAGNRA